MWRTCDYFNPVKYIDRAPHSMISKIQSTLLCLAFIYLTLLCRLNCSINQNDISHMANLCLFRVIDFKEYMLQWYMVTLLTEKGRRIYKPVFSLLLLPWSQTNGKSWIIYNPETVKIYDYVNIWSNSYMSTINHSTILRSSMISIPL